MAQGYIQSGLNLLIKGGLVVGAGATAVQYGLFTVHPGQRAIKYDRFQGIQPEEYGDGAHLIIPWVQRPYMFSVRSKPSQTTSRTLTKDLQEVKIGVRVLHRPEVGYLGKIYSDIGLDYDERVLPSIMNEIMKTTVAQYDAKELLQKRATVSRQIEDSLRERSVDFHIELDDVSITSLTYGTDFARAIEAKQVAEQEAERQKYVVERRTQEGIALKIDASAEAEAANLLKIALETHGSGTVQLRKIEACAEIAETLSRSRNIVYLPPGGKGGASGGGSNILLGINPQ